MQGVDLNDNIEFVRTCDQWLVQNPWVLGPFPIMQLSFNQANIFDCKMDCYIGFESDTPWSKKNI